MIWSFSRHFRRFCCLCLSVCLFSVNLSLFVCLFLSLSLSLSLCLSAFVTLSFTVCLSLLVHLSLSICLFDCLYFTLSFSMKPNVLCILLTRNDLVTVYERHSNTLCGITVPWWLPKRVRLEENWDRERKRDFVQYRKIKRMNCVDWTAKKTLNFFFSR